MYVYLEEGRPFCFVLPCRSRVRRYSHMVLRCCQIYNPSGWRKNIDIRCRLSNQRGSSKKIWILRISRVCAATKSSSCAENRAIGAILDINCWANNVMNLASQLLPIPAWILFSCRYWLAILRIWQETYTMIDDGLAKQDSMASAGMVLFKLTRKIPASVPEASIEINIALCFTTKLFIDPIRYKSLLCLALSMNNKTHVIHGGDIGVICLKETGMNCSQWHWIWSNCVVTIAYQSYESSFQTYVGKIIVFGVYDSLTLLCWNVWIH